MTAGQIVAFAEGLARIASSGDGVKALADHLAQATGGRVLLEDAQRRCIAATDSSKPPAGAHVTGEGGNSGHALRVVAGEAHVGWLTVFDDGKLRRDRGDMANLNVLMRLTGAAIGVELARTPGATLGRRTTFWETLIGRGYHDAGAARDDAVSRGIALAPAYLAVAFEAEFADTAPTTAGAAELHAIAAEAFRRSDAELGILERGAALLIFVPAAREIDASNARTAATLLPKGVAKRKPGLRLSGGVGTVEAPLTLYASVQAAEVALAIGRRVFGAGRVAVYEDLGAYPLLYEGADIRRLQTLARRILAPLRAYDDKHQTELERTLGLYFAVGQNVKTAAARLNVHRHTVFYRLRQIGEICGCSLESPHDQLTLRLAVAIDALHSS